MKPIIIKRSYSSATLMSPILGQAQWSYGWTVSIPVSGHIRWIAANTRDACLGRQHTVPTRIHP